MAFYTSVYPHWDKLLVRGVADGKRFKKEVAYKPYLFMPDPDGTFKTLDGRRVSKRYFDSLGDAKKWVREKEGIENFEFYGFTQYVYTFINDTFRGTIDYDAEKIRVVDIDIEVAADEGFPSITSADKEITAITMDLGNEVVVLGCGDYTPPEPNVDNILYIKCGSESELLLRFLDVWTRFDPDVVTGWNCEFFDIPYLINRIKKMFSEDTAARLSPWKLIEAKTARSEYAGGDDKPYYVIAGVACLDYLALYKKFSFKNQETYRLDHIAFQELGEKKLDFGDAKSLINLYKTNYQRFIEYNVRDVLLVRGLDRKLDLIGQVYSIAYDAKINFEDAFTSVRLWDVIVHNHLMAQNIVVPPHKASKKDRQIIGGFVKDPDPGMYEWVVSEDFTSLYPKIIEMYNIGPDTYYGYVPGTTIYSVLEGHLNKPEIRDLMAKENITICSSGHAFRRDKQSFFGALMAEKFDRRTIHKKRMLEAKKKLEALPEDSPDRKKVEAEVAREHNMQLAIKIMLNSAYGAMSNQYFRWFDDRFAESVTMSGQMSVLYVERKLNEYLNKVLRQEGKDYVIAIDTDSIYITIKELLEASGREIRRDQETIDFVDKMLKMKINPFIEKTCDEIGEYVNCYRQTLEMKREAIADKGVWTGKKRYILNVWDNEGVRYEKPKVKLVGTEAVKSSTPAACREAIKETFEILLNGTEDELIDYVDKFRDRWPTLSFAEVAAPTSISQISKYVGQEKGLPMHVRAAMLFNRVLKERGLSKIYETIKEGDKIKVCFLREPNPVGSNVFAILHTLPPELGLEKYIDYDMQFFKEYASPVKMFTDAAKWKMERVSSLEGLM